MPCKENKCILLPICKGKFEIECKQLATYYGYKTDHTYIPGHDIWESIEKILPNLLEIHGPMIQTKSLNYRSFKIYKHSEDRYPEFKQIPEEI